MQKISEIDEYHGRAYAESGQMVGGGSVIYARWGRGADRVRERIWLRDDCQWQERGRNGHRIDHEWRVLTKKSVCGQESWRDAEKRMERSRKSGELGGGKERVKKETEKIWEDIREN